MEKPDNKESAKKTYHVVIQMLNNNGNRTLTFDVDEDNYRYCQEQLKDSVDFLCFELLEQKEPIQINLASDQVITANTLTREAPKLIIPVTNSNFVAAS